MPLTAFPLVDPADAPAAGGTVAAKFSTAIVTASNGREQRRALWTSPRHEISVSWAKGQDTRTRLNLLYDFYVARRGAAEPFVYVDFDAGRTWTNVPFGYGNGVATTFNLPSRDLTAVTVYKNGIGATGTLTARAGSSGRDRFVFTVAPASGAALTATFTGRRAIVVRFAEDALSYQTFSARLYTTGLKMIEVVGEDA